MKQEKKKGEELGSRPDQEITSGQIPHRDLHGLFLPRSDVFFSVGSAIRNLTCRDSKFSEQEHALRIETEKGILRNRKNNCDFLLNT